MTQGHPHPGQQFAHAERLGEVVVCPGVQGGDLVLLLAAAETMTMGAADQFAEAADDLDAVHVRQAQVQDDQVGRILRRQVQGLLARDGLGDLVLVVGQRGPQESPDRRVVFDHQDEWAVFDHVERLVCEAAILGRRVRRWRPGMAATHN